jgi:hypothetical protein
MSSEFLARLAEGLEIRSAQVDVTADGGFKFNIA